MDKRTLDASKIAQKAINSAKGLNIIIKLSHEVAMWLSVNHSTSLTGKAIIASSSPSAGTRQSNTIPETQMAEFSPSGAPL